MLEAWIVAAITALLLTLGFILGYLWRDTRELIKRVQKRWETRSVPDEHEQPKSMIVEPLTPEQQAAKDMQERIKRVNG